MGFSSQCSFFENVNSQVWLALDFWRPRLVHLWEMLASEENGEIRMDSPF